MEGAGEAVSDSRPANPRERVPVDPLEAPGARFHRGAALPKNCTNVQLISIRNGCILVILDSLPERI